MHLLYSAFAALCSTGYVFNELDYFLQSVTKMIQEACTYVEKTPNLDVKLKLIDTLRTVTDGKVGNRICCCTWRGIIFYVSVYLNG